MRIRYDPKVDAAYIYFKDDLHAEVTTVRLSEDIAVDFGPNEEIFGLEILDASEHLNLNRESPSVALENIQPRY